MPGKFSYVFNSKRLVQGSPIERDLENLNKEAA